MTFQQLQLAMAITKVGQNVRDGLTRNDQLEYMAQVQRIYTFVFDGSPFPFSVDDVIRMATSLRKSKDTRVKADVALTHGHHCFWRSRNKGICSDQAECGHLVSRSNGGHLSVENCIIECRAHNNQRSDSTIEDYLTDGRVP